MKKLWLIAALAACLLLAACTSVKPADSGSTESNTDAEAPIFAEEETADPGEAGAGVEETAGEDEYALWLQEHLSAGGLVFMVPATDEVLEPYDDFDVFNYNPGVQPLLFYTEQDIPDFRLVSVVTENDGGSLTFAPDHRPGGPGDRAFLRADPHGPGRPRRPAAGVHRNILKNITPAADNKTPKAPALRELFCGPFPRFS